MKNLSKAYRFESNPKEREFVLKFNELNPRDLDISRIATPSLDGQTPVSFLNEREIQLVINTIQWLGSPVGQTFLRDCGFECSK